MQSLVQGAISIYRDRDGDVIRSLGLLDQSERREHPVARPTTIFVDASGMIQGMVTARNAEDRPRAELLLLAAEHFSHRRIP